MSRDDQQQKQVSPFPLRLPNSTLDDAEKIARELGITLDALIFAAIEEKMSRHESLHTKPN